MERLTSAGAPPQRSADPPGADPHVCPWQRGPLLMLSARKLVQNPRRILRPHVAAGMTALDVGCGMGYFTIPMAELVGDRGQVVAVDLQPQMLAGLAETARRAHRANITPQQADRDSLNIDRWSGAVDFALLFMVLHEVPDPGRLVRQVRQALAPAGRLLFAEPIGHVGPAAFRRSRSMIEEVGFRAISSPRIAVCRAAVFGTRALDG
ncbi:MAG: class I SAM-dependent methyltransferase [Actinomycetia bacterium]|nr:class I SAM-dependent methyltransferase [Actinomycetes bacterium]